MENQQKKICIIGASGFGREVLCCVLDSIGNSNSKIEDIVCFMEKDDFAETSVMGTEVIKQKDFDPLKYNIVVAVGDPAARKKIVEALPPSTTFTNVIHPSVVISPWVEIGEGAILTAGTILTCNIKIGRHAHLNLHTTIGHDCLMGDYFTTAPGANISGNCTFGDCVYFGTNTAVRQGVNICDDVTIGMGGIVVKNITNAGVYIGNPLKKLEK